MKFPIVLLITFASMIDIATGKGGKISSYRCSKLANNYKSVRLLCDDDYIGDTVHFTSFTCSVNYSISEVKKLSLDCSIPALGAHFGGYRGLEKLDLSDVNLLELEEKNIMGITSLLEIDVKQNKLSKISSNLFANSSELWWADFSNNQISEIDAFAFASATKLKNIKILNNNLEKIPPKLFATNRELQFADFSYNQISEIAVDAFAGATVVWTIDISHNHLSNIPSNFFLKNKALLITFFIQSNQ